MKKILVICNGIALISTIVVNYLSNTGLLNGNTMKTVSDRYFNYFTPAGYAFSIWGLIYLGLLSFVIYTGFGNLKKDKEETILLRIGWWFVISCCANALWVIAWLYDFTGISVLIMTMLFISLLMIIRITSMQMNRPSLKIRLFFSWPFGLYFGWISVAFIANVAAFLTKVNWSGWGISEILWTVLMICSAGLVNVLMIWKRNLAVYGLVGIWALLAISVSNGNHSSSKLIIYTCYIVAAILFLSIVSNALKRHLSYTKNT